MSDAASPMGDTEIEDMVDESGAELDPEQTAIHLHEDRAALAEFAGREVAQWHMLDADEQDIALAIGEGLVERILESSEPRTAAQWVHEVQVHLSDAPGWDELEEEDRTVALELLTDLIERFRLEGTISPDDADIEEE